MTLTLALDVDEVVLDMLAEWVRRYNEQYGDNLKVEEVNQWDMTKVCPKAGKAIYEILQEPDFYEEVKAIPGALDDVEYARSLGMRVIYVSSCVVGSMDTKVRRLIELGFLPQGKTQRDFFAATDKTLVNADVLIDDNVDNVEAWLASGRKAFLRRQPHNRARKCSAPRVRTIREALDRLAA